MPRLDVFHDVVKQALIRDGWTITHDPFVLSIGKKRLFVDLGASQLISAEREQRKIAVEIKSFVGASDIDDLEKMLGQYILYQKLLANQEPERVLYVAISAGTYQTVFQTELGDLLLADQTILLIVFDDDKEAILQWIPA